MQTKEDDVTLGKYGMMRKKYLQEHKKWLYNQLIVKGDLYHHCKQVENEAKHMFDVEYKGLCNAGYDSIQAVSIVEELISQHVIFA